MKKQWILFAGLFGFIGSTSAFAATGGAVIKGTAEGSTISGQAEFADSAEGLKISVTLENVPPGTHGFHIHENGACGDEGKAAGGHYNPDHMPHGLIFKDGVEHVHAGDLGNITIRESGAGKFKTVVSGLTLTGGKYNVAGRTLILHEKEDDFGQPVGNAGGRIACGIIEAAKT